MSLAYFCHDCGARMVFAENVLSRCLGCAPAPEGLPLYQEPRSRPSPRGTDPWPPKADEPPPTKADPKPAAKDKTKPAKGDT